MIDELTRLLPSFDVISFDIFDTLLLRPFLKPTDLFWKLERDEGAKGFAADRMAAERRAQARVRAGGKAEATLDEIYSEIPQWASMKERELEAEIGCLVANPEIAVVFNRAKDLGKKVAVVSDMYLPKEFLIDSLRRNGLDGWDIFYVSSDRQKQKWTGALYEDILADTGVPPDKILHIGDNGFSDVKKANEKGIVAYGYEKVSTKFLEECPFAKAFLGRDPSLEKRLLVGTLARGWHLFKCEHPDWTYWNRIGFLFAGVLGYAYMRFVGEDAKQRGIDHLMFVARDGYILQKIFRVLYPNCKTDYFFTSRAQAILAVQYFGRTDWASRARRQYCINYLEHEKGFHLSTEDYEAFIGKGVLPDAIKADLDSIALQKQCEAKKYLAQFGIDATKTAIVDGNSTHLTVQRFISALHGKDIFTYYLFTNLPVEHGATMCCADWDLRYLRFSEFLFGAPTAPLEDIRDGKVIFQKDIPFFERFKMQCSDALAKGAVACAESLMMAGVDVPHSLWLDWNDAFMDNQTSEDTQNMSLARDSIAIGHEDAYIPVIVPPKPVKMRCHVFGIPILFTKTIRHGESLYRDVYLLGRIKLTSVKLNVWNMVAGRLLKILRQ